MARWFFSFAGLLALVALHVRAEDLPAIPVVKTWAELAAVKPLDLGNNISARVALEAAQAPSGGGVLLYALVDGLHDLPLRDASEQLGPLKVRVDAPGLAQPDEVLRAQHEVEQRDWEGMALFCKAIPVPSEGDYSITVSTLDGRKLAVATLRGEKIEYHAWTQFRSVRWNEIADAPQDGTLTGYLSYSDWHPAIPNFIGTDPLAIVTPDSLKRDSPLPRLLDYAAAPKENPELIAKTQALIRALSEDDFDTREKAMFELRALLPDAAPYLEKARSQAKDIESRNRLDALVHFARAGKLHLQASNVDSFLSFPAGIHASWPEDYFLVRWWVNGKPVILKDAEERPAFDRVGQMRMAEVLRLRWKVDWAILGAKSGDRVAAQILYCPAGVTETRKSKTHALRPLLEFGQMPVLSNRSEFKLP